MEEYLEFAKKLAKEAETIAMSYFGFEVENTWKEDNTPLVKADMEINDLVITRIKETYPLHSVYGEETSHIVEGSKYIWVCDPIDGTISFSCGLPIFVFSLALVDQTNGQPVLGVIHDPVMKNTYYALKGQGAFRNDKRISVLPTSDLKQTYSIVGGSGRDIGFSNLPCQKILSDQKSKVMKFPSFVYGAIQVANGKFVAGVFYRKYGHDVAALKVIVEEAGGIVTDLYGNERRYDTDGAGCVVSNGILHDEILAAVQAGKE